MQQEVGRELLGRELSKIIKKDAFSIRDLFNIPGVNQLPSVIYFQQLNKGDADLVEVRTQLVNLQNDLKNRYGQKVLNTKKLIKFNGDVGTDVNDITGNVKARFNLTFRE